MKRKHLNHEEESADKRACSKLDSRSKGPSSHSPRLDNSGTSFLVSQSSEDDDGRHLTNSMWQMALRYDQRRSPRGEQDDQSTISGQSIATEDDQIRSLSSSLPRHGSIGDSTFIRPDSYTSGCSISLERHKNLGRTAVDPCFEPSSLPDFNFGSGSKTTSSSSLQTHDEWFPCHSQITQGCLLFFKHVSHFVPFFHQPTFEATKAPDYLLLSMLCLAYQYGEDPSCGDEAGSGSNLSKRCFFHAQAILSSTEDSIKDSAGILSLVQSYLLLQISSILYLCGVNTAFGLKTHSKMIFLARSGGLLQPLSADPAASEDLEALWRGFIEAESRKRTAFAVHQIDTLWYQFLSMPRQLSHLEIKHELPCPETFWTASSSGAWAHRQLLAKNPVASIKYTDAVRRFLSSSSDLDSIPSFDPYGAINLTQFLVSSAQEISGWSTITGVLSTERLEPLRSSLVALQPFVFPKADSSESVNHALYEATWFSAMMEIQIWSPSHTFGIVGGSMDSALHQLTHLAPSCEFLCDPTIAQSVQPHVDWFLQYLESNLIPDAEAPWVTLYAYKAFMIAWQLLRGGIPGSMQAVDVADRDATGALIWAKKVFQRRERWKLGRLITKCLDSLDQEDAQIYT
ncbi:hypothetical protein HJFPF1_09576 [Paramyrothecium foliicola]|nr:hypothetical protein HJFPF1_09576 [Paramyrothecium foliicola]